MYKEEELRCSKIRKNFDALTSIQKFLENASEFQKPDDMYVDLPFIFYLFVFHLFYLTRILVGIKRVMESLLTFV